MQRNSSLCLLAIVFLLPAHVRAQAAPADPVVASKEEVVYFTAGDRKSVV